jgi:hypothetical protein
VEAVANLPAGDGTEENGKQETGNLASVLMVVRVYREIGSERGDTRFAVALDSMWRLADEWGSPEMAAARSGAAASLLAGRASDDIDAVLRFLDRIAFLAHRGAFDEELIWHEFYWPLANYWFATADYRQHLRPDETTRWGGLDGLVNRLLAVEARHRHRSADDAAPSKAQMREFLLGEVSAGECTDNGDTEVGRTPL